MHGATVLTAGTVLLLTRFRTLVPDGRRVGDSGDRGDRHFWGDSGGCMHNTTIRISTLNVCTKLLLLRLLSGPALRCAVQ
jgi:hypothetical protein